jgi:hypothetical protein
MDRLSTQSLWSLMGLVIRNAEKLGIHRDGEMMGLAPAATEERRRLWWYLQHLDLALAIRCGLTPLTLMGNWDARLPLNIEDDDIDATMTAYPQERTGSTRMSYCLYTYWVLDQQRRFFQVDKSRFELSWHTNRSLPFPLKENLINQLEEGLNKKFHQYCDPLRPLDALLQISARALVCGMRQWSLQADVQGEEGGRREDHRRDLIFRACMHSLEYNLEFHTRPNIKQFRWLTKSVFPWHACKWHQIF